MNLPLFASTGAPHRRPGRHSPARYTARLLDELAHTPSELLVIAGLWLTCAPLALDHHKADVAFLGWNDVLVGLALVGLGLIRAIAPRHTAPLSLVSMALGGWLLAAPFVRGYLDAPAATVNDIAVGAAVIVLAALSWRRSRTDPR